MTNIINPPSHNHRPTTIGGQQICQDCSQVLITPILSFEDFALRQQAANGQEVELWLQALATLFPCPLDFWLMEASSRLGWDGWPPYVETIANAYQDDERPMPPHCMQGSTARWWREP